MAKAHLEKTRSKIKEILKRPRSEQESAFQASLTTIGRGDRKTPIEEAVLPFWIYAFVDELSQFPGVKVADKGVLARTGAFVAEAMTGSKELERLQSLFLVCLQTALCAHMKRCGEGLSDNDTIDCTISPLHDNTTLNLVVIRNNSQLTPVRRINIHDLQAKAALDPYTLTNELRDRLKLYPTPGAKLVHVSQLLNQLLKAQGIIIGADLFVILNDGKAPNEYCIQVNGPNGPIRHDTLTDRLITVDSNSPEDTGPELWDKVANFKNTHQFIRDPKTALDLKIKQATAFPQNAVCFSVADQAGAGFRIIFTFPQDKKLKPGHFNLTPKQVADILREQSVDQDIRTILFQAFNQNPQESRPEILLITGALCPQTLKSSSLPTQASAGTAAASASNSLPRKQALLPPTLPASSLPNIAAVAPPPPPPRADKPSSESGSQPLTATSTALQHPSLNQDPTKGVKRGG